MDEYIMNIHQTVEFLKYSEGGNTQVFARLPVQDFQNSQTERHHSHSPVN